MNAFENCLLFSCSNTLIIPLFAYHYLIIFESLIFSLRQEPEMTRKELPHQVMTEIILPGCSRLVSFVVDNQCQFSDIWLGGEACEVFTGQVVVD